MVVAGETSGDQLAAELVEALRDKFSQRASAATSDAQPLRTALAPRFLGAGGPRMAAAGVDLAHDLTRHTVFGLLGVIRHYLKFRRLRDDLATLAVRRQPEVVIGVDYSGFNRALASRIRQLERNQSAAFGNWHPKLVQFVSPQVWASRPNRAFQMQRDYDLVLSTYPFEKAWYAQRVPSLRVEFVGHPIVDRHARRGGGAAVQENETRSAQNEGHSAPLVVLLPGSRQSELTRHLPVILDTARVIRDRRAVRFLMVLTQSAHLELAKSALAGTGLQIDLQTGGLNSALPRAAVAIASSGTVTLECAWFGVPTAVLYKLNPIEYQVGRRIVNVPFIAMPNLLAGEELFPEYIQDAATPENLAAAALDLLDNAKRRARVQSRLRQACSQLGQPGAARRAAQAVLSLLR
jgi:lipid-A-disaccharide synthase